MDILQRIKRTKNLTKKRDLWFEAISLEEKNKLLYRIILSMPKGFYRLHSREYCTNLIDAVWDVYGWIPAILIDEKILRGVHALHPKKVYASFTLGLDVIEIY